MLTLSRLGLYRQTFIRFISRYLLEILLRLLESFLQIYGRFFLICEHLLISYHLLLSIKQLQTLLFKKCFQIKVYFLIFRLISVFSLGDKLILKPIERLLNLRIGALSVSVHLLKLRIQMHNSSLVVPIESFDSSFHPLKTGLLPVDFLRFVFCRNRILADKICYTQSLSGSNF